MLTDEKLSDLFFNHEHPHWERSFVLNTDHESAIGLDAAEFAAQFPEFDKDWEWYAEDFLRRV